MQDGETPESDMWVIKEWSIIMNKVRETSTGGHSTTVGMQHTGNMGGRPIGVKKLKAEVLALNRSGLNACQVYRLLVQRGYKIPGNHQNKIRLFRKWIRKEGNPARRGNPRKRAKN